MAVIRSWICQNARCANQFTSWDRNPSCPRCECVRVSWCPAGGHIGSAAKSGDAELRALADVFKMNDMHSAEEGRAAKKVRLPSSAGGSVHQFAGGFAAEVNPAAGAQCVPTANKIDYKIKAEPGNRLGPGALGMPGVRSHTAVEAAHNGTGGRA